MKPVYKTIPILGLTLSLGIAQGGRQTTVTIQERIIEAFVDSDSVFSLEKKADGVYIQGLGAVFKVVLGSESGYPTVIYAPKATAKTRVVVPRPALAETREDLKTAAAAHTAQVNRMVAAFKHYLADYGPALDLPEDEVILLKVVFQGWRSFDDRSQEFQLNTRGGDLKALRSGTLSREGFLGKIVVSENGRSNPRDVVIMGNILETAFDPRERRTHSPIIDKDESWGTYLPGFGALFVRQYSTRDYRLLRAYSEQLQVYVEQLAEEALTKLVEEKPPPTAEEVRADLENKLTDLIADYAPTLKSLQAGEQLVVAVKWSSGLDSLGEMLIFRLKQADIDKFRQPLDLRNRIEVIKL